MSEQDHAEELEVLDLDLQSARKKMLEMQENLEWQAALDDETQRELSKSLARAKWLEAELAKLNFHNSGVEDTDPIAELDVTSFEEATLFAMEHLDFIEIGDVEDGIAALDQFPQSSSWARRTWRSMLALNDYGRARASGEWSADLFAWCKNAGSSAYVVPEGWIALSEDDRVNSEPKFFGPRTFPVPKEVEPSGRVYMPSHIKIVPGGRPAPRLHFYDDLSNTGRIYVGYIGPHLPNGQKY